MSYIKCPHCNLVVHNKQLYSMAHSFNRHRDEYQLRCPNCQELFVVGYQEYYRLILSQKRTESV